MFSLKAVLTGHTEDVRGLSVSDIGILTGSRDKTAKLWRPKAGPNHTQVSELECVTTFVGHTDFVGPVVYNPSTGQVVTGSRDTTIICWSTEAAEPVGVLSGHEYQVSSLAIGPTGDIVSASLDKSVRVWRDGHCVSTLAGHDASVLSLAIMEDGTIVSGSGDKTIRCEEEDAAETKAKAESIVWRDGRCMATLKGHTDSVRGLAYHPKVGVASASHDHSLRLWDRNTGAAIRTIDDAHSALVYSVDISPEGLFLASGSEDNSARLWTVEGEPVQTIEHPGCVWDVRFTPEGELLTACSDGRAYLWTSDHSQASAAAVKDFEERLASYKAQRSESAAAGGGGGGGGGEAMIPAGLKIEDTSVLQRPGDKDGKLAFVKEGGVPVAYSWSAATFQWDRLGEVTGGAGKGESGPATGGPGELHGQQYDHVFDVDVEDGAPPRKLALNRGDNPYDVADRFLLDNELPVGYRDQIVQFILRNTDATGAGGNAGQYMDPFTGASAYVPQTAGPTRAHAPAANLPVTGGGFDPYTGTSATLPPAASAPALAPLPRLLPVTRPLLFEAPPPLEGLLKKIREFAAGAGSSAVSAAEVESVVVPAVQRAIGGPGGLPLPADQFDALFRLLGWPSACLFPVFDVLRSLTLHAAGAQQLVSQLDSLLAAVDRALNPTDGSQPSGPALQTALKVLSNMAAQTQTAVAMSLHSERLLGSVGAAASAVALGGDKGKGLRLGLSTWLLNLAALWRPESGLAPPRDLLDRKIQALALLIDLIQSTPDADSDALARSLAAAGTLVIGDAAAAAVAIDLSVVEATRGLMKHAKDAHVVQAGTELLQALTA